ncbi:hypothetical protein GQF01_11590 [Paenibacillus sp. 5J-6]|uniref:Uncharacterized protein n=1 Tax=Paenibacillus silvestris TaxID=2606219 RepID=A0A6L8UXV4_9BACL|nr:hypothetical protein [Paenibacillus silvestris]MZQ82744.1 hypothetical protein [Paenibacillus silvestris]
MKKFKTLALTFTVATSVLLSGTSAFALGTANNNDSSASPNVFSGSSDSFDGTIDNSVDKDFDYYKWVNDTGSAKSFYVNFDTYENRSLDYRINSIGVSGIGAAATRVSVATGREAWLVYLPAGERLTVQVTSATFSNYDPTKKYVISLGSSPWF